MFSIKSLLAVGTFLCLFQLILSHGTVWDPVQRSSLWVYNQSAPHNYDHVGLFCGGFEVQWKLNEGKCGICGDDYRLPQPRPNENGGVYGNGVIVNRYEQGSLISVVVQLTANHWGHFQFSVCPLKHPKQVETEDCFLPVSLADGSPVYEIKSKRDGYYLIKLRLPDDVVCDHCVFRWHYHTGNSWGFCSDGSQGKGCGQQETFRTCSDIQIVKRPKPTLKDRIKDLISSVKNKIKNKPGDNGQINHI